MAEAAAAVLTALCGLLRVWRLTADNLMVGKDPSLPALWILLPLSVSLVRESRA